MLHILRGKSPIGITWPQKTLMEDLCVSNKIFYKHRPWFGSLQALRLYNISHASQITFQRRRHSLKKAGPKYMFFLQREPQGHSARITGTKISWKNLATSWCKLILIWYIFFCICVCSSLRSLSSPVLLQLKLGSPWRWRLKTCTFRWRKYLKQSRRFVHTCECSPQPSALFLTSFLKSHNHIIYQFYSCLSNIR